MSKKCYICYSEDNLSIRNVKYKDKIYTYYICKECSRDYYYKHRKKRLKETKFFTSDKYKKFNRERVRKYYKRNPLKYKARYTVRNAIVSGKIIKPKICSVCGSNSKIEAHHNDYRKPLEIIWLCKICHIKEDQKNSML